MIGNVKPGTLRLPSTALWGWLSKAITFGCQLATIRLVSSVGGESAYAAWVVAVMLSAWFMLGDIGLGSALQNAISQQRANTFNYQTQIRQAGRLLLLYAGLVTVVLIVLMPFLDDSLARASGTLPVLDRYMLAGLTAVVGFAAAAANVQTRIWFAEHRFLKAQVLPAFAIASGLVTGWLGVSAGLVRSLPTLFVVTQLVPQLVIAVGLVARCRASDSQLPKTTLRFLLGSPLAFTGFRFFAFALAANFVLQVDAIVAVHFLPSDQLAKLGVLMRLIAVFVVAEAVLINNAWPLMTQYWIRSQIHPIRVTIRQLIAVGITGATGFTIVLMIFGEPLMRVLVKGSSITISAFELLPFGLYMVCRVVSDTFAMALTSASDLKAFVWLVPIQAIINVSLQIALIPRWGISGVAIALTASFLCTTVIGLPIFIRRKLRLLESRADSLTPLVLPSVP